MLRRTCGIFCSDNSIFEVIFLLFLDLFCFILFCNSHFSGLLSFPSQPFIFGLLGLLLTYIFQSALYPLFFSVMSIPISFLILHYIYCILTCLVLLPVSPRHSPRMFSSGIPETCLNPGSSKYNLTKQFPEERNAIRNIKFCRLTDFN